MSNRYLEGFHEHDPESLAVDRARAQPNSAFLLEDTFANAARAHRLLPIRPSIRRVAYPQALKSIAPPASDLCRALRLLRAGTRTKSICGPRSAPEPEHERKCLRRGGPRLARDRESESLGNARAVHLSSAREATVGCLSQAPHLA